MAKKKAVKKRVTSKKSSSLSSSNQTFMAIALIVFILVLAFLIQSQ